MELCGRPVNSRAPGFCKHRGRYVFCFGPSGRTDLYRTSSEAQISGGYPPGFHLECTHRYGLFWIFPAAGPEFAFSGKYPFHAPAFAANDVKPMIVHALPNAIPSVHVLTALLIWFNSRPWRLARIATLIFLSGT